MPVEPIARNILVHDAETRCTVPDIPIAVFRFQDGTPPFRCQYISHVVLAEDLATGQKKLDAIPLEDLSKFHILGSSRAGLANVIDLTGKVLSKDDQRFAFISHVKPGTDGKDIATSLELAKTALDMPIGEYWNYVQSLLGCIIEGSSHPQTYDLKSKLSELLSSVEAKRE